jgi:hypothetical protein
MKKAILAAVLLGAVGISQAQIGCFWRPTSGVLWSTAANWNNHDVPDSLKPGATDTYKAYFLDNWDECILDYDGPTIDNLHLDQSKPLRIVSGGRLTVTDWAILSYSNPGANMVIDGGTLNCMSHLFIGPWSHNYNDSFGARLTQNGGTVNIYGVCGPGFDHGRGHYQLNGGTLNVFGNWELANNGGAGSMDITQGVFIKSGDITAQIQTETAAGRLTAYGGYGKIVFDYNVTHPGKTTVKAIAPAAGDLDDDQDVDLYDLRFLAREWLYPNCGNPANLDEWCKIDMRDFRVLSKNWLAGIRTRWHIASTVFPTDDWIVTPHYAEDFGIAADGVTDVTAAIQSALVSISNLGGGALYLPAGLYKVSGTLTIPSRVTLRGDWAPPTPDGPVQGTILMAYAGRGSESGDAFLSMSNCAGIKGIAIWYPEQAANDIQPYPPAIRRVSGSNQTVENVTFVNAYIGFSCYSTEITASPFLRGIYGTPLKTGIEFDCLADVGRIETVHFSPDYWKNSGLPNAPVSEQHRPWIYENGTGITFGRIDWSYAAYVTIEGYNEGLKLWPSRNDSAATPNGQCYGFTLRNCKTGIRIVNSSYAGFMFTRFAIQGAEVGVEIGSAANQALLFHTCRINGTNYSLHNRGSARVLMMSCQMPNGPLRMDGGYLSVLHSDFDSASGEHIILNSGVRGASILGNRFSRAPQIADNTSYPVNVDHTPLAVSPLPAYDFKKPSDSFTAAKRNLFVVTEFPYHAKADGVTDDTAAFQAALTDAGANGGGIVFVPGGDYRLDGTLTIPTGVELRGVFDLAHSTSGRGSVLNTYHGKNEENGTPFIQIQPHAGIRGLTIHHAGQIIEPGNPPNYGLTPYPFMIRGLGSDIYILNVAATIPYQLIDLATYRCDRHYVDYVLGTALKTGIYVGGGSQDGQIHNCQFNPSSYAHQRFLYDSIPDSGDLDGVYQVVWAQGRPYLFGNMSGEILHQNFVFGGMYGVHLIKEGDVGPSGHCMGMGVDQCTRSLQIDDVGENGLDMINSQIVTVNQTIGRYLETSAALEDTFRMFSTCCWGTNDRSVLAGGGDLELQLFHIARNAETAAFDIRNEANVRNLGGNVTDYVNVFLQIEPTARAAFIGNIIRTSPSQMPVNTSNVLSIGNLRVP